MFRLDIWRKKLGDPLSFVRSPRTAIQFMSDLHLEVLGDYSSFTFPKTAPLLLLAGDVGRLSRYQEFRAFLERQCSVYDHVYLVLGNHEFYALTRDAGLAAASSLAAEPNMGGKLTIMHRTRVDLGDNVVLLGCTLQSHIPEGSKEIVRQKLADFRQIKDWSVEEHNEEHKRDVTWLKAEIESIQDTMPGSTIIVATHHAPSHSSTSNPNNEKNPWRYGFATDLLEHEVIHWRGYEMIHTWVFGHTHWCADFDFGHIRLRANQRGYALGASPSANATKGFDAKARVIVR